MEVIRFLHAHHALEFLGLGAFIIYLAFSGRIAKARREQIKPSSDRSTSRTSEYYSTEIDELQ